MAKHCLIGLWSWNRSEARHQLPPILFCGNKVSVCLSIYLSIKMTAVKCKYVCMYTLYVCIYLIYLSDLLQWPLSGTVPESGWHPPCCLPMLFHVDAPGGPHAFPARQTTWAHQGLQKKREWMEIPAFDWLRLSPDGGGRLRSGDAWWLWEWAVSDAV